MRKDSTFSTNSGLISRGQGGSTNLKPALKEKFVSIYEGIFEGRSPFYTSRDEGFAGRAAAQRFWDELLLLKVNGQYLSQRIARIPEEQLAGNLRGTINSLFSNCVRYLADENFIRVAHALETLAIIFRQIFKKRFSQQALTIISLVAGSPENADTFFQRLIGRTASLLQHDNAPLLVKSLALRLFLVMLTATSNVNTGFVASYLFVHNVSDALVAAFTLQLPHERRQLEFDAVLVLLLLLLWRESPNPYLKRLSSPSTAPLLPLLHAAESLLCNASSQSSDKPDGDNLLQGDISTASMAAATAVAAGKLISYANYLMGWAHGPAATAAHSSLPLSNGNSSPRASSDGRAEVAVDVGWANRAAGIMLVYFLVTNNPTMASANMWPPGGFIVGPNQSLALLWGCVLRIFLSQSCSVSSTAGEVQSSETLVTKLCLVVLRVLSEDTISGVFLLLHDPETHDVASSAGKSTASRGVACTVFNLAVKVLGKEPPSFSQMDPDLYFRAATVIAVILNFAQSKGLRLEVTSSEWGALWAAAAGACRWSSSEDAFLRPGVLEVAEVSVGLLESCLGSASDLLASADDIDQLHAFILSEGATFEALTGAVEKFPSLRGDMAPPYGGGINLVNIKEVREHYEVQAAAMGVRGFPNQAQALAAVKKKGNLGLKLKQIHVGPSHKYTEGPSETKILNALVKLLVAEQSNSVHDAGQSLIL